MVILLGAAHLDPIVEGLGTAFDGDDHIIDAVKLQERTLDGSHQRSRATAAARIRNDLSDIA